MNVKKHLFLGMLLLVLGCSGGKGSGDSGSLTLFAGALGGSGIADGIGADSRFRYSSGLGTDGFNLYVADDGAVRKVEIATAEVVTLAGNADEIGGSADDGAGIVRLGSLPATVNQPTGLAMASGQLFMTSE